MMHLGRKALVAALAASTLMVAGCATESPKASNPPGGPTNNDQAMQSQGCTYVEGKWNCSKPKPGPYYDSTTQNWQHTLPSATNNPRTFDPTRH